MPDFLAAKQNNKPMMNKVIDVLPDLGAASNGAVEVSDLMCHADGPASTKVHNVVFMILICTFFAVLAIK